MRRAAGPWSTSARRILPAMRAWRRAFHEEPELAYEEWKTRDKIVEALRGLEITPTVYDDFTGVVATIGADRPGPVVALRADMDGLPVEEATGLSFRSKTAGKMHACGHDVHLSCLLGAATLLVRAGPRLRGPVRLIFQPAEEEGETGGAKPLIERGCLEKPRVDFVLGQHVAPEIPAGLVGWRKGPLMAAADRFRIVVRGHGGHAAYPHRGPDAVLAAAEVVQGLQAVVSRARDPVDPVVVSVGMIHGGTRPNILPTEVVLEGTVRTFRPETREQVERLVRRRVRHIVGSLGATARIEYRRGYPVLANSPPVTERVVGFLGEELGEDHLVEIPAPGMGAEDFARYLERVPGTFLKLGAGVPGPPATLHSPTFAPPDESLVTGAAALAAATMGLQFR
ncbi:MAG TPA: M20 family metallopeptidase [Thermoplasmata archaeon]|nr:M20 family metallopeptidase [Thermoplasmata archaeon]